MLRLCPYLNVPWSSGRHSTMTHSHRPVLRSKLSTKSSLLSMFSLLWNHEMCGIGNPVTTALRISSSPSVALVSFSGCVNLGGVVFTSCEAKRRGIWFWTRWKLNFRVFLLACSHWSTPRPIHEQMGCLELCGGVHAAQRQISTQTPTEFCVNLSVSVSVSVSVSGSVNTL